MPQKIAFFAATLLVVYGLHFPTVVPAQTDEHRIREIQDAINQLQNQLAAIHPPKNVAVDKRVRSLGIAQKQSVTPDSSLRLKFYDLSDLFSVSPQYPAVTPDELGAEQRLIFSNPFAQSVSRGRGFGVGGR